MKLWDPLRIHAILERIEGVFATRRYTNPRLPLPFPLKYTVSPTKNLDHQLVSFCLSIVKFKPILIFLSPLEKLLNFQYNPYNISDDTLSILLHYRVVFMISIGWFCLFFFCTLFHLYRLFRRSGSPWTISVKFYLSTDGQRTKWRRNIAANFNRLSRTHEHYRRQTDGRTTT